MDTRYKIDFPSLTRCFRGYRHPVFVKVTIDSPLLLRQSLLLCAKYFQREGYSDWVHYELNEDGFIGFLFLDRDYPHAVGGCIFRKREYKNLPKFWTMHWIWLHPFVRNKGLLSEYMNKFNDVFGYWYPEYPHSKAMGAFINKYNMIEPSIYFSKNPTS